MINERHTIRRIIFENKICINYTWSVVCVESTAPHVFNARRRSCQRWSRTFIYNVCTYTFALDIRYSLWHGIISAKNVCACAYVSSVIFYGPFTVGEIIFCALNYVGSIGIRHRLTSIWMNSGVRLFSFCIYSYFYGIINLCFGRAIYCAII